jgi:hypothetical protein
MGGVAPVLGEIWFYGVLEAGWNKVREPPEYKMLYNVHPSGV